ncbi:MAG TPA: hypothetical protein GX006_07290, partial [Clostridiales bacterium]|nr:hypothetical protein [Clostridiales bacterium]
TFEIRGILALSHWGSPPCECLCNIHCSGVPVACPFLLTLGKVTNFSVLYRPKDGRYQITYFGEPFPNTPGEEQYYNFLYTDWLYFTDAFHRVQAQGKFPDDKTAVTMIQYGQLEDYAESDSGLHGMTKTPYQPGETMLLIVEAEENINLSKATLKEDIVTISSKDNDAAALDKLKGHFESITYLDIDAETPVWKPFNLEDENSPRKLFIYKYNEDGVGGSFIEVNGEYQDFMSGEGLSALPFGKYEAVFPIYWQKNVPNKYVRADDFSRNRYKIDDTVHFTFEVL